MVVAGIESLQARKAKSILEFAASEHGFTHVGVFDGLPGLQPVGLGHGAVGFVVRALAGFVVSKKQARRLGA